MIRSSIFVIVAFAGIEIFFEADIWKKLQHPESKGNQVSASHIWPDFDRVTFSQTITGWYRFPCNWKTRTRWLNSTILATRRRHNNQPSEYKAPWCAYLHLHCISTQDFRCPGRDSRRGHNSSLVSSVNTWLPTPIAGSNMWGYALGV